MRTITIYIDKETSDIKFSDKVVSFEPNQDYRVLHYLVILDKFTELKNGLRMSCAIHLDWCIDNLVDQYGIEAFQNYIKGNGVHSPKDTINEIKALEEKDQCICDKEKNTVCYFHDKQNNPKYTINTNEVNELRKYMREKLGHFIDLIKSGDLTEEDLDETLEELI